VSGYRLTMKARGVHPDDERMADREQLGELAGDQPGIDRVECRCLHTEQELARARCRAGDVDDGQFVEGTVGMSDQSLHLPMITCR